MRSLKGAVIGVLRHRLGSLPKMEKTMSKEELHKFQHKMDIWLSNTARDILREIKRFVRYSAEA